MFRFYFRKFALSPMVLLASLLLFLGMIFDSRWMYGKVSLPGTLYLFQYISAVGVYSSLIPLATVLSVCVVQYQITVKNVEVFLLHQSSPKRYVTGGVLAAAASGAITNLLAVLLFFAYCNIVKHEGDCQFFEDTGMTLIRLFELKGTWFEDVDSLPILYGREIFIFVFRGIIFPVISFTLFLFIKNPYIIAILPFALYQGSEYFWQHPLMPEWTWIFDPGSLSLRNLHVSGLPDSGLSYMVGYIAVVLVVCSVLSYYRIRRSRLYGWCEK
ncbi:MAG: hypothetical protein Q4F21_06115 [Lachnospiraceae bacterium]|nr:hypothetical protein [Lachnospiraceae bacterium]